MRWEAQSQLGTLESLFLCEAHDIRIPDEASNGALGVNSVNLFCCKQNVLDLMMEVFFMLVKYS